MVNNDEIELCNDWSIIIIYHNVISDLPCKNRPYGREERVRVYFKQNMSLYGERRLSTALFLQHPRICGANHSPRTHHGDEYMNAMSHKNLAVVAVVCVFFAHQWKNP